MKKKFVLSAISVIAVIVLTATIFGGCTSVKAKDEFDVSVDEALAQQIMASDAAYKDLEWLCSDSMKNRYGSLDADELTADSGLGYVALQLASRMEELGYQPLGSVTLVQDGASQQVEGLDLIETSSNQRSINVQFMKPASAETGSKGQIILMAHYDNLYGTASYDGSRITAEGAYDNGAAVAALLQTATFLKDIPCSYDIIFAFLGSSVVSEDNVVYYCWDGAKALEERLYTLIGTQSYNPVLAINLWRLGGGENLYMYSHDEATSYNNYFYAVADKAGLNFSPVPAYKHAFDEMYAARTASDVTSPSGFLHVGMLNDSLRFMNKHVPTLTYMSLAWENSSQGGYTEMSKFKNCALTSSDTLNNMKLVQGGGDVAVQRITEQLNSVTLSIVSSVTGANTAQFTEAMSTAKEELSYDSRTVNAMTVAVLVITWTLVIGLIVLMFTLRGRNFAKLNSAPPPPPVSGGGSSDPFEDEFSEDKNKIFDDFD